LLQARLLEKKARIEATKSRIAGMQAENAVRASLDQSVAYDEADFAIDTQTLEALAGDVARLGDEYAKVKGWL